MSRKAIPFWEKVDKTGECWLWTGSLRKGYGRAIVKRASVRAHQIAWEEVNGPQPNGMVLMHICDNRACVRPDHLSLGTQEDNLRDMTMKGRRATGDRHPSHTQPWLRQGSRQGNAKLTEADIPEVRRMWEAGSSLRVIATRFNVSRSAIHLALVGKSWRHV